MPAKYHIYRRGAPVHGGIKGSGVRPTQRFIVGLLDDQVTLHANARRFRLGARMWTSGLRRRSFADVIAPDVIGLGRGAIGDVNPVSACSRNGRAP